jgi:hypothetical protein
MSIRVGRNCINNFSVGCSAKEPSFKAEQSQNIKFE